MQDSENSKPGNSESTAPSTVPFEPQLPPNDAPEANNPFIPRMGLKELTLTWEMLVKFSRAIEENDHWSGKEVEAVALGLTMIKQMAGQYHVQVEMARKHHEDQKRKLKDQIKAQGGTVNGEPASANA